MLRIGPESGERRIMANINIRRPNGLGKAVARQRTESLAMSMEAKLGIRWQWQGDRLTFDTPRGAARGTTGTVSVDDTSVRVEISLPVLLRAFRGAVEGKINDELNRLLR
jgi:putative polyhydroxyalkanoate system protein